jgi:hypothetical protein
MFTLQKHSNYGTSTPAVARTAIQGRDILQFIACADSAREHALAILLDLQRHLLKCVEIHDALATEITKGHSEFSSRGTGTRPASHILSPGAGDLQSRAESFLQSAKLALAATGNIFEPFYGQQFGHKYNRICAWADKEFGVNDQFATVLRSWAAFAERIVKMRNCVDHPDTAPGAPLIVANFTLGVMSPLIDPSWGLTGEPLQPMLSDFTNIIEQTTRLGEDTLVGIFNKLRLSDLLEIEEIPSDQRDPACPKRLRVGLPS